MVLSSLFVSPCMQSVGFMISRGGSHGESKLSSGVHVPRPLLSALTTSVENWDEKFCVFHYFLCFKINSRENPFFELLLYFIGQDRLCTKEVNQKSSTNIPSYPFFFLLYPPRSSTLFPSCCITCIIVFSPSMPLPRGPFSSSLPAWFHLPSRLSRVPPSESASFGNHAGLVDGRVVHQIEFIPHLYVNAAATTSLDRQHSPLRPLSLTHASLKKSRAPS